MKVSICWEDQIKGLERRLLDVVQEHSASQDLKPLQRAIDLAKRAHQGQLRDDGSPYILHPIRVALVLAEGWTVTEFDLLCAALLHDVIEENPEMEPEVRASEGRAGMLVDRLTKPPKGAAPRKEINREYYRRINRSGPEVQMLKVADKLDNLRDAVNCPDAAKRRRTASEAKEYVLPIACALDRDRNTTLYSTDFMGAIAHLERSLSTDEDVW